MIYIFSFIICICVCWLLVQYLPFKNMTILKHFLEANNLFCIEYLIFSCCFLAFDDFAVWKSLVCVLVFSIILLIIFVIKKFSKKKWNYEKWSKQELILLIIIVSMIVPFIYITTEDISADTDQGAYFLHTCILIEEKSKEVHSLQEIGKISDEVDEGIRQLLEDLPSYWHESDEDIFYLHALNSWCSYTALFGKMLGIWDSMKAVNYLYILIVLNLFYICKRNTTNECNIYLYIFMFALSPLLLYIGKAGLPEIAVLYLVSLSLNYIFEDIIIFSLLSGICTGLIGYVHVSMYVYIPIITGMALLESVKRKKMAWFNIIQLLMFSISIWYGYKISPMYIEKQYFRFTLNGKISLFIIFILIDFFILIGIFFQLFTVYRENTFIICIRKLLYEKYRKISIAIWSVIFVSTICYGYLMCFTDIFAIEEGVDAGTWNLRREYINKGITAFSHLNIINIARATGIIGILIFATVSFLRYEISDTAKVFNYISLYEMIVFTVLQMDTPSNYYCSRYFIPVLIPMIVLTIISTVKKRNWCIYCLMIVVLYNHHFWPTFLMGGPKVGQYELLQDTLEVIPENAIVFCNPESHMINARLSGSLRVLNNNQIFNLKTIDQVLDFYPDEIAYIISENELEFVGELIKSNVYLSQYSFGNGYNGSYAIDVGTYQIPLYIYQIG